MTLHTESLLTLIRLLIQLLGLVMDLLGSTVFAFNSFFSYFFQLWFGVVN